MLLSIITINYNNYWGLKKTCESVISQKTKCFEWIIIDGGSTDCSKSIIENFSSHISFSVSQRDSGIYNAMNKGIQKAKGTYVLFLNSGDYFKDSMSLSKAFNHITDADFEIFDIEIVSKFSKPFIKDLNCLKSNPPILFFLFKNCFPHQSTFIKRSIFAKHGLYNESLKLVSDWALLIKAFTQNDTTYHYHSGIVLSCFDGDGQSSTNEKLIHEERQRILNQIFPSEVIKVLKIGAIHYSIIYQLNHNFITRILYRNLIRLSNLIRY